MPEPDQLGSRIRHASSWPTPERPPIEALRGRSSERIVRRRATHLASAAVTLLIAVAGFSVAANQTANRPIETRANQPEAQPVPDSDTGPAPTEAPEMASPGAPPPTIIDELIPGDPRPAEPPPEHLAPPGAGTKLHEAVRGVAPEQLVQLELYEHDNTATYGYKPGATPPAVSVPGRTVNGPEPFAGQVIAFPLTAEDRVSNLDAVKKIAEPVHMPSCKSCTVGLVDRRPEYIQYLIVTDDSFVNIIMGDPSAWPHAKGWATRVATQLSPR